MNFKTLLISFLLFVSSAQAQNVFIFTDAVSCLEGLYIVRDSHFDFKQAGINPKFNVFCVNNYKQKEYRRGSAHIQLRDLNKYFYKRGYRNNHYIVRPFNGYFDGVAVRRDSISVAKPDRVLDASEQMSHEVAHVKGASHDFSNCNLMGYRRCGYPAKFNRKAIKEMR